MIVQKLLQENRHGSKRDIYYMHPSVFSGEFKTFLTLEDRDMVLVRRYIILSCTIQLLIMRCLQNLNFQYNLFYS